MMLRMSNTLLLLSVTDLLWAVLAQDTPSIFDPRVYNFYYYVQHNAALTASNISSVSAAADHWQTIGIVGGLQACGSFHVLRFIENYPSLLGTECPPPQSNYSCAILYYLQTGFDKNLYGYSIDGGTGGVYTISSINNSLSTPVTMHLFVSVSDRMGGSIDSIVYGNYEYINAWNHARNLQITASTKYGECYQMNEAGSKSDAQYNYSTTEINSIGVSDDHARLHTDVFAAYYMAAHSCTSDDGCGCAHNTANVSQLRITKNVSIAFGYQNSFWINCRTRVAVDQDYNVLLLKAPMVWVNQDMTSFWKISDTWNGGIYPLNISGNGGTAKVMSDGVGASLLMQATNDSRHAIAVMPVVPQNCNGGIWIVNELDLSNTTANQSSSQFLQYIFYNVTKETIIEMDFVICVGSVADVQMCVGFA